MTTVWAHRGASATERENTVPAFAAAVALGADGIELDVRCTADGRPAIHHDAHLPDGRPIADVAAADLPPHVPLLDAALDACGDLVVNVEIKEPPSLAEVVVAEIRNRAMAARTVVSCFDLATIDRVRSLDEGIPTGLLAIVADDRDLQTCVAQGHGAYHPHHAGVDARHVGVAHDLGLALHVWTCDDPDRIRELASCGVDAVVTNDVVVALRALGR